MVGIAVPVSLPLVQAVYGVMESSTRLNPAVGSDSNGAQCEGICEGLVLLGQVVRFLRPKQSRGNHRQKPGLVWLQVARKAHELRYTTIS